jgi:hypothetical protein
MPIRTHRGRAAVYRRLWGWPLRSPKHLAFAVALLAVAATAVGLLLPNPSPAARVSNGMPTDDQNAPSVSPQTTTASPPSFSVPQAPPAPTPPSPQGLAAVDAWSRQWVNHPPGTTRQQWLDRLRFYTSDEFFARMASVDPANVPSVITGPLTPLQSTATSMQVRLPTNQGDIQVVVINTPQGWRVSQYN